MADSEYLEREREGQKYFYSLSSKGKKKLQKIKKRERERRQEEDDIFDYESGVTEFIEYWESEGYGLDQVKKASLGRNYVYLNYEKLEKFNVELADDLLTDPDRVLSACKEAVREIPETEDSIDVRVNKITDIETQTISDLSARDLNRLVTVEGVIQSVSKPGSRLVSAIFECEQCGERYSKDQEGGKLKSPYKCDCGSKKFQILREEHKTVRFVRIKEKPDKRSRNKAVAVLEGDIAEDETKNLEAIGSGVKVTGYLETFKKSKQDSYFNFRLKANNIEVEDTKWEIEQISEEEEKKIQKISEREDLFDYLSESLAYEQLKDIGLLKKTFLLWLLGRTRKYGNLHVLCIGDPGTGKSHLARYVGSNFGKVIKSVATGATEVGLTASVIKDEVTGEFTAEGGSLPMADDGFHITDEIDELDDDHYSAFNEALSDGTISLDKADLHAEIAADVAEFSIGNPNGYTFDRYDDKYEQIPIKKDDLISRYGLILGLESNTNEDKESIESEREKIKHILERGDASNFEEEDYLDEGLLTKYIYYAQKIYPIISQNAKTQIEEAYIKLFEAQDEDQNFVKPRHANALAILSIAFAKMELAEEVRTEHVTDAFEFFRRCYSSIDFEIGKDDISDLSGQNTKCEMKILEFVNGRDEKVEIESIVEEVDLPESSIENTLEKLLTGGELYEPESGKVNILD